MNGGAGGKAEKDGGAPQRLQGPGSSAVDDRADAELSCWAWPLNQRFVFRLGLQSIPSVFILCSYTECLVPLCPESS